MRTENTFNFLDIIDLMIGDVHQLNLYRSKPYREVSGEVLGQDTDEALKGSEHRTVNHDRNLLAAVLCDIGCVKASGQSEVELYGAALPGASERVIEGELNLRAVERALAGLKLVGKSVLLQCIREVLLCPVPHRVVADALLGPQGELDVNTIESEGLVDVEDHLDAAGDLAHDLIFPYEKMSVILGEAADSHQSVKRS